MQRRIERFISCDLQAIVDLGLLERRLCHILILLRDAQPRVLCKGQVDGILQREIRAGCRRQPDEHGKGEQCGSPAARCSLHVFPPVLPDLIFYIDIKQI